MALPGSKSISNRVLLLSAIAEGTTSPLPACWTPTIRALGALRHLGVQVSCNLDAGWVRTVQGVRFRLKAPTFSWATPVRPYVR